MKTTDIKIGSVYDLKVGKNTTPVRIMKAAEGSGWEAVGLTTNKPVAIKSADRLVGLHSPKKTPTSAQGAKLAAKSCKYQPGQIGQHGPLCAKVGQAGLGPGFGGSGIG